MLQTKISQSIKTLFLRTLIALIKKESDVEIIKEVHESLLCEIKMNDKMSHVLYTEDVKNLNDKMY